MSQVPRQDSATPILCVMGVGFLLRIYHLGSESAWTDELWAIDRAKSGIVHAMKSQVSRADPNWVYDTILYFWMGAFGDSEYSTRMLSVILGTVAIYGIYRVGEQLLDRSTGIVASAILSASILHIDFSQQARMYTLSGCLALASFYSFSKVLSGASKRYYAVWLVSSALAFYTHFLCALTLAAQIVYLLIRWKRLPKEVLENFAILQVVMLLMLQPCFYTVLNKSSVIRAPHSHFGLWDAPTLSDVLNVFVDFSGSYYLFAVLGCFASIALYYLIIAKDKKANAEHSEVINSSQEGLLIVLLWILVPSLLVFCVATAFPGLHAAWRTRFLFSYSLGFVLLCARGYCLLSGSWLRTGLASLFVLFSMLAYIDHDHTLSRQQIRQSCDYVHQHFESGDTIAIYPSHYRSLVAPYYMKWYPREVEKLTEIALSKEQAADDKFRQELGKLLQQQRRVWLLYFLDHDESRGRDSTVAIATTRDLLGDQWCVSTEQAFESYTRVFCKPYTGAYVLLLAPCKSSNTKLGE